MAACNIANLSDVADRIGIQKSNLSKILSGDLGLSPTNLRKLVTGISAEPEHQFAILSAHLYDEAERAGFPLGLLGIEFQGRPAAAVTFTDLPAALQQQLRLVADEIRAGDEGLAGTVGWIAGMIGEARVYPAQQHKLALVAEDSARGPLSSPTDEVIAAHEKKHKAERAAAPGEPSTRPRSYPTPPPRSKK
jgi:hypothetical protein